MKKFDSVDSFFSFIDFDSCVEVYIDGACKGNPGIGGYGVVFIHKTSTFEMYGGEDNTTNNRMELMGAITALEVLLSQLSKNKTLNDTNTSNLIIVHTDSEYVRMGITSWINKWKVNGWNTKGSGPVKNKDLWVKLNELSDFVKPEWRWVKSHSGIAGNERADALANHAIIVKKMQLK